MRAAVLSVTRTIESLREEGHRRYPNKDDFEIDMEILDAFADAFYEGELTRKDLEIFAIAMGHTPNPEALDFMEQQLESSKA